MGLEFIVAQIKNPNKLERDNLEREILGITTVHGMGGDHTVHPYPTSYQNPKQTKLVRVFGTGGFAPYRLPEPIYRHKKGSDFFYLAKNKNKRGKIILL
jgi:hypothetical protein